MSTQSSQQIRELISLLENVNLQEKDKDKEKTNSDADLDSVMLKAAGLEKVVGNLNVKALIDLLELPKQYQNAFRSGINALKADKPKLTTPQAMAIATAFDHMLTRYSKQKTKLGNLLKPIMPNA